MKTEIKNWIKKYHRNGQNVPYKSVSHIHFNINQRVGIASDIRRNVVEGMIGSIASGRTCDGLSYLNGVLTTPPTLFQEFTYRERGYENADGPLSFYFCKPHELPEDFSRDVYAEAAGY